MKTTDLNEKTVGRNPIKKKRIETIKKNRNNENQQKKEIIARSIRKWK